ncbi:hypothetical protein ACFWE5_07255 [Cellulosimicrobium funkei]|uniref:hypothetical protein n=1 Tax=Cellulosimicrobium funkei TaxID=264251 RepID=UPI003646028D
MSRTITTAAGRDGLPRCTVVYSADGTIAGRYDTDRGVVLGDERTFPWSMLQPPLRILFCPTCDGRNRETVDMVCQTCGTNYAPTALDDIAAERSSHAARGYDDAHDSRHTVYDLVQLSQRYANNSGQGRYPDAEAGYISRTSLVKAASLLVAAIDRLDQAEADRG